MADQFANGQEAERLGFGLHIPFLELTEEKLLEALNKIVNEPGYSQTAKTLGGALVDQVSDHFYRTCNTADACHTMTKS